MFNRLYEACETGVCSASCSGNLADATDNNPYTAGRAELSHAEGRSWALLPFPAGDARAARQVYLRGNWPVNTSAWATVADGEPILLGTLGPEQKHADIVFTPPAVPITGLKLQSVTRDGLMRGYCYAGVGDCKTLVITEAAVQTEDCFEQITLDLGASKEVSVLSLKFSAIYAGMMATSVDGLTFVDRLDLKSFPFSYSSPMVVDIQNVTARYLRFRYFPTMLPLFLVSVILLSAIEGFTQIPRHLVCTIKCMCKKFLSSARTHHPHAQTIALVPLVSMISARVLQAIPVMIVLFLFATLRVGVGALAWTACANAMMATGETRVNRLCVRMTAGSKVFVYRAHASATRDILAMIADMKCSIA